MKILVFGDCHWSTYSSILRKRGLNYSTRLHNLIDSINWVEEQAIENHVDAVVGLGDFFDKETLNSEEITALKEIMWSDKEHYFLIGNHEMGRNDLFYSSTKIFDKYNFHIIDTPITKIFCKTLSTIAFIPYTLNPNYNILNNIYNSCSSGEKIIIFSHNDIAGIQLGQFVSKSGFEIKDIEENCDLFINGHLHNGSKITDKIINLGNLTGQNFSEDAHIYKHNIMILDSDTLKYELIENPYAINFYKIDAINDTPILSNFKNSVITLKCYEKDVEYWEDEIRKCSNIIESRVLIEREILNTKDIEKNKDCLISDHISEFKKFVIESMGNSDNVLEELEEVCR